MALQMYCNEKEILNISSGLFIELHVAIESIVDNRSIELTPLLQTLIEKDFHMGWGGIGVDIADYIQIASDLFLFASIVKDAILQLMKECPNLPKETKVKLWNFYRDLILYGKKLKYNSSITIRYDDTKILYIPKLEFEAVCNIILNKNKHNVIMLLPNIKKLLQLITNSVKSITINTSDYLTTKEDYITFIALIKESFEFIEQLSSKPLTENSRTQLWNFCNELISCSKSITSD
ncbi:MAG: hypothetical protein OHK0036_18750 [Bacteroidia bacterium]